MSVVISMAVSLFCGDSKDFIPSRVYLDEDKRKIFKEYIKYENKYKKGLLSQSQWLEIKEKFISNYNKN